MASRSQADPGPLDDGKAPTIRDVARAAGVSRATVSRVLNGGHWVSPDAAAAVERAIAQLGYVASHSARALNTGRSGAVALVVAEPQERLFEDPTFSVLVRELIRSLRVRQTTLYITLATDHESRVTLIRQARSHLLDGLVLASMHGDDPLFAMLLEHRVPAVICTEPLGRGRELPHITINDRAAAGELTRHLADRGCRRIGILTGPLDTASARNRLAGYHDVLRGRADPALSVECAAYSSHDAELGMQTLLRQAPDLDGLFAASDLLATGAVSVLTRTGRTIPGDVAVAGFDDSILATTCVPPLTTAHLPFDQLAREAINILFAQIDGIAWSDVELRCSLVRRASTDAAATTTGHRQRARN